MEAIIYSMPGPSKRLLVVGAHPDDCEFAAGGLAAMCARRGWTVRFLTATNGNAGHQEMSRRALAARRGAESRRAAAVIGATAETLGEDDGGLYVTRRTTEKMIAAIRRFDPDVLVTHRTCDYHRDHRMTAQLVLDASFVLLVPLVVPRTPAMTRMPVILYHSDRFTEGPRFRADVVLDIGPVMRERTRMFLAHESQVREWLPWVGGRREVSRRNPVRDTAALERGSERRPRETALRFARQLARAYGRTVRYAEAYQVSEYGSVPAAPQLKKLLPC